MEKQEIVWLQKPEDNQFEVQVNGCFGMSPTRYTARGTRAAGIRLPSRRDSDFSGCSATT